MQALHCNANADLDNHMYRKKKKLTVNDLWRQWVTSVSPLIWEKEDNLCTRTQFIQSTGCVHWFASTQMLTHMWHWTYCSQPEDQTEFRNRPPIRSMWGVFSSDISRPFYQLSIVANRCHWRFSLHALCFWSQIKTSSGPFLCLPARTHMSPTMLGLCQTWSKSMVNFPRWLSRFRLSRGSGFIV